MNITILNGNMDPENSLFKEYIMLLTQELEKNGKVELFNLDQMNLKYCTGCWSCWWKTPGKCTINDDAEKIYRAVINSDFVIYASPIMAGFTSSALKKISERFVALLHPYIKIIDGESHHRKRYERYPNFGLILQKESDTDDDDIRIINDIYRRFAINFHSSLMFTKFIETDNVNQVAQETTQCASLLV